MPKSPKILHIIHSGAIGGGPKVVLDLATRLPGVQSIAAPGDGPLLRDAAAAGLTTYCLPFAGEFSFAASIPWLSRVCRTFDLVHLHGQFAAFYGSIASRIASRPAVYTAHFPSFVTDSHRLNRMRNHVAENLPCHLVAAVVTCSKACQAAYLRRRLCSPLKISTIYNGVPDTPPVQSAMSRPADSQAGDLAPTVLAVGRFTAQKGFDLLVHAVPAVVAAVPSAKFVFVGDGEMRPLLENTAQRLGVTGSILFTGLRRDVADLYATATVVVVPSRYEIFPLVPLEAMMAGLPVVATNLAVLREAIVPEVTGLLVDHSSQNLAAGLTRMLQDFTARQRMGEAGRQRATEYFGVDRMTFEYSSLYSRVLGRET